MADGISLQFPNLPDVIDRMAGLDRKVQRTIARRATLAGIRVIRDQVRANAARLDDPRTDESIERNVSVQFASRLSKQQGGIAYRLGVRGGAAQYANTKANRRSGRAGQTYQTAGSKANPGGDTWYWRFLEFGTSKMPARPIFRPAINQAGDEAIATAIREALALIGKETGGS